MFEDLLNYNVSDIRFVAFDTETTGVYDRDHIIEIAALAFDEDFEHRRFSTFVKCPIAIPAEASKINGIKDEMLVGAPAAREAYSQFLEFLKVSGMPRVMLAHNASFDVGMFLNGFKREKFKGGDHPAELVLDTCALANTLLPELPKHSLGYLTQHFKYQPTGDLHRAMVDVEALHFVFLKLLALAADRILSSGEDFTLNKLIELCCGYYILKPDGLSDKKDAFFLSPILQSIQSACLREEKLAIRYGGDDSATRYITPLAIKTKGFRIYVEALCHEDNIKKSFRADRIKKVFSQTL